MKKVIFLLTILLLLTACNALYPVANYNLKDYNKNPDGTYTRKTDENGNPVENTKIIIKEIIDKDKKFNYNPEK